ncbi:winged helix DNA-binding domain-containing protein [Streptomyces sp. NPDC015171]|uniref:winged helix DNA-binding domain-containing protein n=1 Tax=Streptomyces sp. NPDC015171 TaxID=3364945 RepID=UPI0036F77D6D
MKVSWNQVLAWRLRRQYLEPLTDPDPVEVVGRLCGVQAQVTSSAELAIALRRATADQGGLASALAEGALMKTWAMRGTLHWVTPGEGADFLSLLASARTWEKPAWTREFGATPQQVSDLVEKVSEILHGAELTREELAAELIRDRRFTGMEKQLRSGWGALLKPLAWQGALCHGSGQGNKITFIAPRDLPGWKGLPDPAEAGPRAFAAYLGAYGPAGPELFDHWLSRGSLRKTLLRAFVAELGDRLTAVEVEGRPAYVLTEHADELAATEPTRSVHLLGGFDQYILGPGTKAEEILPQEHRAKVSKTAGWIAPLLVAGGRITGVWEVSGRQLNVTLFPGASAPAREDLEAAAGRVARAGGLGRLTVQVS